MSNVGLIGALTAFATQNPPWQLSQLDANFTAIATSLNGIFVTGNQTFNLMQGGTQIATGQFNWVTLGGVAAFLYVPQTIVGTSISNVPITLVGIPTNLTPAAQQNVRCGNLLVGAIQVTGQVLIQTTSVIAIVPEQVVTVSYGQAIGVAAGFPSGANAGLAGGWVISYSLL